MSTGSAWLRLGGGALTAALALSAMPAFAQVDFRNRDMARPDEQALEREPVTEARRVMQIFGRCLAGRFPRQSREFAAMLPGNRETSRAASRLAYPDCFDGYQMRLNPIALWGSISAALYQRDFGDRPPVSLAAVQLDTDRPPTPEQVAGGWVRLLALHRYTNCVARHDPQGVRTLILGPVGGAEENAAIAALQPALSACLASGEVRFNRDTLRAYLSGALYQLTLRASMAGAGSTTIGRETTE